MAMDVVPVVSSRWEFDVDPAWLEERKSVLTASEVAKLLPSWKKAVKAPGTISPEFAALWAEKNSDGLVDTSSPSQAAARGHVMEPWAIDAWNDNVASASSPLPTFHHWDDILVASDGIGFSPDGMDTVQPEGPVRLDVAKNGKALKAPDGTLYKAPSHILEVKAYDPRHHMKCCITDRMSHDELFQLAMAFCVLPLLETATLLFFCPAAPITMHYETYTREQLSKMIEIVGEIQGMWNVQSRKCQELMEEYIAIGMMAGVSEQEIWEAHMRDRNIEIAQDDFRLR